MSRQRVGQSAAFGASLLCAVVATAQQAKEFVHPLHGGDPYLQKFHNSVFLPVLLKPVLERRAAARAEALDPNREILAEVGVPSTTEEFLREQENVYNVSVFGGRPTPPIELDVLRGRLTKSARLERATTLELFKKALLKEAAAANYDTKSALAVIDNEIAMLRGEMPNEATPESRNQDAVIPNTGSDHWSDASAEYAADSFAFGLGGHYTGAPPSIGGVAAGIAAGLTGIDAPKDIADLVHDFHHWEWSWAHFGNTMIDAVAIVPVIGVIKNVQEGVKYGDELVEEGSHAVKYLDDKFHEVFHYTSSQWVKAIKSDGLRPGTYATPSGDLSSLQAQLELALSPLKSAPDVRIRIDLEEMRTAGFEIPTPTRISSTVVGADGRIYQVPGGGFEVRFPYAIPPKFIEVLPIK